VGVLSTFFGWFGFWWFAPGFFLKKTRGKFFVTPTFLPASRAEFADRNVSVTAKIFFSLTPRFGEAQGREE